MKAEYNYQEGQLNGPAKFYYENGFLREESFYKDGKLHGINKKYYTNGLLAERATYNNGVLWGVPFKFEYGDIPIKEERVVQSLERKIRNSAWRMTLDEEEKKGDRLATALQKLEEFLKARLMFAGIVEADYSLIVEQEGAFLRINSLFDPEDLVMLFSSPGVLYFKGIESDPAVIQQNTPNPSSEYEWIEMNQQKLLMEKKPWLTVWAVETADFRDAGYNKRDLILKFKDADAKVLEKMTGSHVGEKTALLVGNSVVAVLDVGQPLRGGELILDSELLSENMQKVVFSLVFRPVIPVRFKTEDITEKEPQITLLREDCSCKIPIAKRIKLSLRSAWVRAVY